MSTRFQMTRDITGSNGFGLAFSDVKYAVTLASGVHQSFTVPSNFKEWMVIFSYEPGVRVWIANNAAAADSTGTLATTTSELNPVGRKVLAGDVIDMITPDTTAQIGVTLYVIS
jgi:hypothetical protein